TAIHFVLDASGPTRAIASGGLRHWHDGRDVPDVMLAMYDYPKTSSHPAFTVSLKVNFAEGAGDNTTFRFVGPDGVLTIGDNAVFGLRATGPALRANESYFGNRAIRWDPDKMVRLKADSTEDHR